MTFSYRKTFFYFIFTLITIATFTDNSAYALPSDLNNNQKYDIIDTILSFKRMQSNNSEVDLALMGLIDNLKILTGINIFNKQNIFISSNDFGKITFKYDENIDYQSSYLRYYILDSEYNRIKDIEFYNNGNKDHTVLLLPGKYYISIYSDSNKTVKEVNIESGQESILSSSDFGKITFKYDENIDYQSSYLRYYILDSEYNRIKVIEFYNNGNKDQTVLLLPGKYYITIYSDRNKTVKEIIIE